MKIIIAAWFVPLLVAPVYAQQKPCEELKTEIVAKLEANGVKNYQVDIVPAAEIKDQKVIGSCELGTKKITYSKASPAPDPAPKSPAK